MAKKDACLVIPARALETPEKMVKWIHDKAQSIFTEAQNGRGESVGAGGHKAYNVPGYGVVVARPDDAVDRIEIALTETVRSEQEKQSEEVAPKSPLEIVATLSLSRPVSFAR